MQDAKVYPESPTANKREENYSQVLRASAVNKPIQGSSDLSRQDSAVKKARTEFKRLQSIKETVREQSELS